MRRISGEELEAISKQLRYDPDTGNLFWKQSKPGVRRNGLAGGDMGRGYFGVKVSGTRYRSHHVAWFLYYGVWPSSEVDHINCDRGDNRVTNLRLSNRSNNIANSLPRKGSSEYKGVSFHRGQGKWQSRVCKDGVSYSLGYFDSEKEAALAYDNKARELFLDWARVNGA